MLLFQCCSDVFVVVAQMSCSMMMQLFVAQAAAALHMTDCLLDSVLC